jgi:hypothetical protein
MKRNPKQYPMNGPSLEAQRLMEHPRRNRAELWPLIGRKSMREETRAVLFLDGNMRKSEVREILDRLPQA